MPIAPATVPDRDTIIFCDGKQKEAVDALRVVSRELYEKGGRHALSRNIIQYTSAGWRVCGAY